MQAWLTATISGASAVAGGVVVAVSNYVINRVQVRDAKSAELRAATSAFLQSIDMITRQLRIEPTGGKVTVAINEAMRRAPLLDYKIARLNQRIFTPYLQGVVDLFAATSNRLLLVATNEMLVPLGELADLISRAYQRDAQWDEDWDEARGKLIVISRRVLGEKPIRERPAVPPTDASGPHGNQRTRQEAGAAGNVTVEPQSTSSS